MAYVPWSDIAPYVLAAFLLGYFVGTIPFGIVFGRLAGVADVRKIGSGNIGATNVLRTGKKWAAVATLLCDAGKGAGAVLFARYYAGEVFAVAAGLGAFLGHVFPIWLGFKGGKGVATFLGIVLALFWPVGVLSCMSWLVAASVFRVSSLAALVAAASTPVFFLFWYSEGFLFWYAGRELLLYAMLAAFLAALIFFTHRTNIARLFSGDEPTIGKR